MREICTQCNGLTLKSDISYGWSGTICHCKAPPKGPQPMDNYRQNNTVPPDLSGRSGRAGGLGSMGPIFSLQNELIEIKILLLKILEKM